MLKFEAGIWFEGYHFSVIKKKKKKKKKKYGSPTRVTRLKVAPNMADPISGKENRTLQSESDKNTKWIGTTCKYQEYSNTREAYTIWLSEK